jgi:hypothetical protein
MLYKVRAKAEGQGIAAHADRSSCLHPVIASKNLQLLNICKVNLYIFPKILAIILDLLLKLYYAVECSRNEHSASGAVPAFFSITERRFAYTNPLPLALSVLRPRERERGVKQTHSRRSWRLSISLLCVLSIKKYHPVNQEKSCYLSKIKDIPC